MQLPGPKITYQPISGAYFCLLDALFVSCTDYSIVLQVPELCLIGKTHRFGGELPVRLWPTPSTIRYTLNAYVLYAVFVTNLSYADRARTSTFCSQYLRHEVQLVTGTSRSLLRLRLHLRSPFCSAYFGVVV
jgi:hypothetical protein